MSTLEEILWIKSSCDQSTLEQIFWNYTIFCCNLTCLPYGLAPGSQTPESVWPHQLSLADHTVICVSDCNGRKHEVVPGGNCAHHHFGGNQMLLMPPPSGGQFLIPGLVSKQNLTPKK